MTHWPSQYLHFPNLTVKTGPITLRPLQWQDREPIRQWRNDQVEVLRQTQELSSEHQDAYYRDVIRPQFEQIHPDQVLWAFERDDVLTGYGGIVHITWADKRGEVSFLTETSRANTRLASDWTAFLGALIPMARERLGLHKLTTETYATRPGLIPILESQGFVLEGTLREHHDLDGTWVDSLAHGLLLN